MPKSELSVRAAAAGSTAPGRLRLVVAAWLLAFAAAAAVPAATIVVTSDADVDSDDGTCTLREALAAANANFASSTLGECAAGEALPVVDRIEFDLPAGPGSQGPMEEPPPPLTIDVTASLPPITEAVVIDGETQPGASCDDLAVRIDFDLAASVPQAGLKIESPGVTVRGLHLTGRAVDDSLSPVPLLLELISIEADGAVVECNVLDGNPDPVAGPSGDDGHPVNGVHLSVADGARIGRGEGGAGVGNVFVANDIGALVQGDKNVVAGNVFGLDPNGNSDPNDYAIVLGSNEYSFQLPGSGPSPTVSPGIQEALVRGNSIFDSTTAGVWVGPFDADTVPRPGSFFNCLEGNAVGLENEVYQMVYFRNNWWGAADGPAPSGSGDAVVGSALVDPFLRQPPSGCPGPELLLTKEFVGDPVAAGGTVELRFTIANNSGSGLGSIGFSDTIGSLPPGLMATGLPRADVCGPGSVLAGSMGVLELTGGRLDAGGRCTFAVVLSVSPGALPGLYRNDTSEIAACFGPGACPEPDVVGPPAADVLAIGPRFEKSFTNDPVLPGADVDLVFTITNITDEALFDLSFTDDLGGALAGLAASGLPLVEPCGMGSSLDAGAGGTDPTVVVLSGGVLGAGETCTIPVTLTVPGAAAGGDYPNLTTALSYTLGEESGGEALPAADTLRVLGPPALTKSFVLDPVAPGAAVELEFTLVNTDGARTLSDLAFTDDLDAALAGLRAVDLPKTGVCGPASTLSGGGTVVLANGSLPPGGSCTFSATLAVPATAPPGTYANSTGTVTGKLEGTGVPSTPVSGDPATDDLAVEPLPLLTKTFLDDPVAPGGSVVLRFGVVNTDTGSLLEEISFRDDLKQILPGDPPVPRGSFPMMGTGFCGGELALANSVLSLTGGSLGPGESCLFDVILDIPATAPGGVFRNTTSRIAGFVDVESEVSGAPASDDLEVTGRPRLSKSFVDDPAEPGETVDLLFTLELGESSSSAIDLAFTDDLAAALDGLVAEGLPADDVCGAGSRIEGTAVLTFSGGELSPDSSCSFVVTLRVPVAAELGSRHLNETSELTGSVGGVGIVASPAADSLEIAGPLRFSKEFDGDPVQAGEDVVLRFSIVNLDGSATFSGLYFADDLDDVLAGLGASAAGLPATDVCGGGSMLTETAGVLELTGGLLGPGETCTFQVALTVPGGAAPGQYPNRTSPLFEGGPPPMPDEPGIAPPASDTLVVRGPLELEKVFLEDPKAPGQQVVLEFRLAYVGDSGTIATDISFTDDLSAALLGLAVAPGGLPADGFCGPQATMTDGGILAVSGAELAAGGSCTFRVTLAIPGDAGPGDYRNTTSPVSGFVHDESPISGEPATDVLTLEDRLTIEKATAGVDADLPPGPTLVVGDPVAWTYVVTNGNGIAASDVRVTDSRGVAVTCSKTELAAGESMTCTGGGTVAAGQYDNLGTVSAAYQRGRQVTASDPSHYFGVPPEADLAIAKSVASASAAPGEEVVYTVTVLNSGPREAESVVVADPLPAGLEFVSTSGCNDDPNGVPTCTLGEIAAGASREFLINARVALTAPAGTITNQVTVVSATADPNSANNSASVDLQVPPTPPFVVSVGSLADTGDGRIVECEEVKVGVTQLLVQFNEALQDPPGDSGADDATNPENYRLLATGPDLGFSTSLCGPPQADDVEIPIAAVSFDDASFRAALALGGELPNGLYRLLVCGSTSIRDLSGNRLDGNGDGVAGDDFNLGFRVERTNLLTNGELDCDLGSWVVFQTLPPEAAVVEHSPVDVRGSPLSGAVSMQNRFSTGAPEDFFLGQCAPVEGGVDYVTNGFARIQVAPGAAVALEAVCEFFDGASCAGSSLGNRLKVFLFEDSRGVFVPLDHKFTAPAGARSAICTFGFGSPRGSAFFGELDALSLKLQPRTSPPDGPGGPAGGAPGGSP